MDATERGVIEPEVDRDGLTVESVAQQLLAQSQTEEPETPDVEVEETEEAEPEQEEQAVDEEAAEQPESEQEQADEEDQPSEEVPSQETSPEEKKGVEKRIAKEVARRKAAEEKAEKIKAEYEAQIQNLTALAQQSTVKPVPVSDGPLGSVDTVEELEKRKQDAEAVIEWAEEALDRDDETFSIGGKELTRAEVKQHKRAAERLVAKEVPARLQFLQARHASQQRTNAIPWLNDKSSKEYLVMQQQLRMRPQLAAMPDGVEMIAYMIEGAKALIEKQAKTKEPEKKADKPKQKAPPVPTDVKVVPPKREAAKAKASDFERKVMSSGDGLSTDDVAQLLLRRSQ